MNTTDVRKIEVENEDGELITIELQEIIDMLSKSYTLFYTSSYDDNFDNSLEEIQEAIQKQEWYPIDESLGEWIWEAQDYQMDYILGELKDEIESDFNLDDGEAEAVLDEFRDWIVDTIRNRDDSDPIGELLRNTSNPVMFYETGEDIEFDVPFGDEKDLNDCIKQIKKALKIKLSETRWDDQISIMVQQGYSGQLVIYFLGDVKEMMNISDKTHIHFRNPHVAIINTYNGSGDDCQLQGHEFSIPMDTENIWLDKNMHYSYTYEVCGMHSNWCDGTDVTFEKKRVKKTNKMKEVSALRETQERDKKYQEVFDKGGCTFGDMNYTRHRNMVYRNDYPCGSKCPTCSTFFID